jgi:hypothetical protein
MSGTELGSDFETVATVDGNTTTATISSLLPNTSYRFQVVALNAAGSSPPSNVAIGMTADSGGGAASIPGGVNPATARLIIGYFQQFLARTPAPAEVYSWASAIDGGALTPAAAAMAIEKSLEGDTYQGTQLWQRYLHRSPDLAGLQGLVNYMQAGASINDVAMQLLGSDEYFARVGGSDFAFVSSLYQNVLNRNASPAEIAGWLNGIAQDQSRAQMAADFLSSAEHVQDEVFLLYSQFLDRGPDPSDAAGWELAMANGLSYEQAAAYFGASIEFFNKQQ